MTKIKEIVSVRPTKFHACQGCLEATSLLRRASLQVDPNHVENLVVVCSQIQEKTDEHAGTGTMDVFATPSGAQEPNTAKPVVSEVVYCLGVIQG